MRELTKDEFDTTPTPDLSSTAPPHSGIRVDGRMTDATVTGLVLEAAMSWERCYVALMTDDIPDEDMLSIHLLDPELTLLDSAVLGGMYSTGSFSNLELIGADTLQFRFIDAALWRVDLLRQNEFRWPFFSDPKGISRKFGFGRRFRVSRTPLPISQGGVLTC